MNNYGKQLLDLCMDTNHLILNGCLEVDAEGCHTRIENGNKSVLDYAICSVAYLPYIKDFKVCNLTPDSDHCRICVLLKSEMISAPVNLQAMQATPCTKYCIKSEHVEIF